ncbi:Sulfotransferase domain protein [Caulifigura coniformis]|uniref:Sulfotransferase domain protein n=1 Tax=Caulifigura coniformis TaxID=2527983 RepID=A0A517S895_9PLAN|nr:sulfotransferase [Caulifigura coniformis]QDT52347.1 Sulfotransferase domain protein [Caulifigura coniformis]
MSQQGPVSESSHQSLPVWCGLTLRNWLALLRLKPTIDRASWKRVVGISAASTANSVFSAVENLLYSRRTRRATVAPPVFVLGHWRSGTTFLHQLLTRDPRFAAPTLFECSFPSHFLATESWLARLTSWMQPRTRPMDAVENSWDAPAEEEIALLLLTLASPYLVSAFPDRPEAVARFNSLAGGLSKEELQQWKDDYVRFLRKLSLRHGKPLVLKSPANTSRLPLLLELFPEARFIHIVRNPYAVFSSTMHLHRVLSRENGLTSRPPVDLEERVLSSYLAMYHSYHLYRMKIPAHQRYELKFEDLEGDPVGELQAMYAHFGWSGADRIPEWLARDLERQPGFRKNSFRLPEGLRRRVAQQWEPVFHRYGYPFESPSQTSSEPAFDQTSPSRSGSE